MTDRLIPDELARRITAAAVLITVEESPPYSSAARSILTAYIISGGKNLEHHPKN